MTVTRKYCDACGKEIDGDYIHVSKHAGWTRDDDWYGNLSQCFDDGGDYCMECEGGVKTSRLDTRWNETHEAPKGEGEPVA